MMYKDEIQEIKDRYQRRKSTREHLFSEKYKDYTAYLINERELVYTKILHDRHGTDLRGLTFLEIGAGVGSNIPLFYKLGLNKSDIWLNELLEDRLLVLEREHSETNILPGDALDLKINQKFDIVFQSAVFSSILDLDFRKALADKMMKLLKPGGLLLWYDFIYDNPFNNDVKGIPVKEIRRLFPDLKFNFQRVTFLPPLGRIMGKNVKWFNRILPVLRTHVVAWAIKKD